MERKHESDISPLLTILNETHGFTVQLKFLEDETNRDLVMVSLDETELASHPDLQHNKNYRNNRKLCEEVAAAALAALAKSE